MNVGPSSNASNTPHESESNQKSFRTRTR